MCNSIKFECHKEVKDKEGSYIIVKGLIGQTLVTLVNIYALPESGREFFKSLFNIIALEAKGICVCGGDLNVMMATTWTQPL